MHTLGVVFKLIGYTLLVAVTYPLAWWLRPDGYDGERFAEYDDDDAGTEVDDEPCTMCGGTGLTLGMPPCPCKRDDA